MSDLTELESADAYCRYLTRHHYENFAVISRFLPRDTRMHLARIYAFCRSTDEYGDESRCSTIALARLSSWQAQVRQLFQPDRAPVHPVLIALAKTVDACRLSENLFLDLIQANIQDQTVTQYQDWEELEQYCMLSAAPVGRMVLGVFGIDSPRADRLSDDVCIGLQLANHAQDVKRDAEKGRVYLLQSVSPLGDPAPIRDLCDRSARLLESGRELEGLVPFALRAQLALYRLGGMAVVAAIRGVGYRTDRVRPTLSAQDKIRIVAQAVTDSLAGVGNAIPQTVA